MGYNIMQDIKSRSFKSKTNLNNPTCKKEPPSMTWPRLELSYVALKLAPSCFGSFQYPAGFAFKLTKQIYNEASMIT
jgi:hypothetical protein